MLAKSKLNSIETLISQASINMEISHKEFITILKEKDKYGKMKDNLRNENEKYEMMRLNKINEYFMPSKNFFFLSMYKMLQISKKECEKCEVKIIDKERYFWVNRKELEVESHVANWAQIFDKFYPKKQKQRH